MKRLLALSLALVLCAGLTLAAAPTARAAEPLDTEESELLSIPIGTASPEPVVTREPISVETSVPIPEEPETVTPEEPEEPIESPIARPGDAAFLIGDLDGDDRLNSFDAAILLCALVGLEPMPDRIAADANRDGVIDLRDAVYVINDPDEIWYLIPEPITVEPLPVYKPVLYLYPEAETDVTVTLGRPDALTTVYPAYDGAWRVTAAPDGTLTGETGRDYYALYYEADVALPDDRSEGFCVARADIPSFLEESLAILGLTEREAEEMIVYWLPQMQAYDYVFVRFASAAQIDEAMPLTIDPAPDSVLRVWMLWSGLEEPLDVPAQTLEPAERRGFAAVEWGGIVFP